ncbi:uncharacterized protein LOC128031587 [Carassius gibelio]|uniref:uncharacterized protein LOC128031587 n=1 Tax=Carassius gibelio TaxID=101364 RepID=UPI0022785A12|nr:uncharacterized protein LOC128031587 [Carassius gibelio]
MAVYCCKGSWSRVTAVSSVRRSSVQPPAALPSASLVFHAVAFASLSVALATLPTQVMINEAFSLLSLSLLLLEPQNAVLRRPWPVCSSSFWRDGQKKWGEDTFELHSAVEKQIRDLEVRQAQLRERRAVLESSWADAHKSGAWCTQDATFPDVLHSGTRTPQTLGASTAEDVNQAPGDDFSPSCPRDLHPEQLRSPPQDGMRCCDHRRLHRPTRPCYVSPR